MGEILLFLLQLTGEGDGSGSAGAAGGDGTDTAGIFHRITERSPSLHKRSYHCGIIKNLSSVIS